MNVDRLAHSYGPVREDDIRIWCQLMRDNNPVHLDPAAAASLGFGARVVNPGPANLALLFNMLLDGLPGHEIAEVDAMFHDNAQTGDLLVAEGRVLDETGRCVEARLLREGDLLVSTRVGMRATGK